MSIFTSRRPGGPRSGEGMSRYNALRDRMMGKPQPQNHLPLAKNKDLGFMGEAKDIKVRK